MPRESSAHCALPVPAPLLFLIHVVSAVTYAVDSAPQLLRNLSVRVIPQQPSRLQ